MGNFIVVFVKINLKRQKIINNFAMKVCNEFSFVKFEMSKMVLEQF